MDAEAVLAERPDRVVVATGAVPYVEPLAGEDLPVVQAWDVLDGLDLVGNQIVVADWGGDWTGLAVAEVLAARGHAVRLVTGAAAFGEAIHQYQRNMYLGRLDDAGVELVHHLRPVAVRPGAVEFRNAFSDRAVAMDGVDALVLNGGRVGRVGAVRGARGARRGCRARGRRARAAVV